MTADSLIFRGSRYFVSSRRGALARLWRPLALMLVLFGALHLAGATSRAEAADGSLRPCDRYAQPTDSYPATPCVAAHSTVRALFAAYAGRLYQVQRESDQTTKDIGVLAKGGYANAALQDSFCAGTQCTITLIYDQTAKHNDLIRTPLASNNQHHGDGPDAGTPAEALPTTAGGRQVYGLSFSGHMGYHSPKGAVVIAVGDQPEGMYMVTSGTHTNEACCFDYGNAEATIQDNGPAQMDAIYFGNRCEPGACRKTGPGIRADLENGLFPLTEPGNGNPDGNPTGYTGNPQPYVTAMLKNDGKTRYTLKTGDAQGSGLKLQYTGALPMRQNNGKAVNYSPMQKKGGIVLGTGGDDSNGSIGSFFEGAITQGVPADAADDDVQANIVSVGYGGPTGSQGVLAAGSEISLRASVPVNSMAYLLPAPSGSPATVATVTGKTSAATWIVRRGLASTSCDDRSSPLSFEAKNYPGAFLRHKSGILYADQNDGKLQTLQDETFCVKNPGLSGESRTTSFQVTTPNYTNRYVGRYDGKGVTEAASGDQPQDNRSSFKGDVSWFVGKPLDY